LNNQKSNIFLCLVTISVSLFGMTIADKEEYEKLGLSQVEWDMIQKSHMSKGKLHHLLKCGISIPEYFKSPWKEIKLSEGEWLKRRCAGQSSSEIRAGEQTRQSGGLSVAGSEWTPIQSFILPGYNQIRRSQYLKGYVMSGLAVASLGFFAAHCITTKSFQPLGLFFLVPDMLWSGIDIGIQIRLETNPDAQRFTLAPARGAIFMTINVPLQPIRNMHI
jgi:hypothetical protein